MTSNFSGSQPSTKEAMIRLTYPSALAQPCKLTPALLTPISIKLRGLEQQASTLHPKPHLQIPKAITTDVQFRQPANMPPKRNNAPAAPATPEPSPSPPTIPAASTPVK